MQQGPPATAQRKEASRNYEHDKSEMQHDQYVGEQAGGHDLTRMGRISIMGAAQPIGRASDSAEPCKREAHHGSPTELFRVIRTAATFDEVRKVGKRKVRRSGRRMCLVRGPASRGFQLARVFVIVAINAEEFPVASIRRVMVVIVILVVHSELDHVGAIEFARATPANPRVELQCLFAVGLLARFLTAACFGDDVVEPCRIGRSVFGCH